MSILRLATALSALVTLLSTACVEAETHSPAKADQAPRVLRLGADPTATLRAEVLVLAAVVDPANRRHEANGVAAKGGTVRGLCESLRSSLVRSRCDATYHDGESTDDPLRAAMHQVVVLPSGWRFVEARATAPDGSPASWLTTAIERELDRAR